MRKYGLLAGILIAFFLAAGSAEALWGSYDYRRAMINTTDCVDGMPYVINSTGVYLDGATPQIMWAEGCDEPWLEYEDYTNYSVVDNAETTQQNMTNETALVPSFGNPWDGMSNLVSRWDLNNNANDSTSIGNDGTITGATFNSTGKFGGAYHFDGTGDYGSFSNTGMELQTFSMSVWAYPTDLATHSYLSYMSNYDNPDGWGLYNNDVYLHFAYITGGGNAAFCNLTAPLTQDAWNYIYLNFSGSPSANVDGTWYYPTCDTKTITYGTHEFVMGAQRYVGGYRYYWNGEIDEYRYYSSHLTPKEVTAEYQSATINSLGSEETGDIAPTITITSPSNTTYYTASIDFNFSVSDAENATFHVIAYNDTDAIYDSAAYANNTNQSFSLTMPGGQHNVTVWANDSAGNNVTSEVLYYVWMGLNVSAYNNETDASMTNWSVTATNGTFTYTNGSQNNPSLIEWNLLPQGPVNITIDDNSTTLYFYNTTYERSLNNSAIVQLDAYLQPKSENPIVLSSSAGWSMLQGQSTTITCTASETTPEFKVNSVLVASPYTFTVQTGQYVAACNVYNETENYAPKNVSNILVVNPLISCTSNETFAYSATITTTTNLTTLDFTTFASQNTVRSNLGDVYIPLANDTWINTTGGSYVIVNNTGQSSFTVYFGNYYANKSYNTSSLQGDQKNITTYTQINPSIMYNVLDELTGEYMFPPNATLTSIIHCSLGETYIQIEEGDSKILIASSAYLDKASLRVLYTADAYYSRQLYPAESDALALSFYVVDALQNALDRIDFLMEDINYYSAKLQVYKTVQSETLIITEGYFDASHYFSVYLMEDSDYYMRTVGTTGTITDFGRITIVAPATKTLGQVTMDLNPQATLISDNILMNAWANTGRTALYIAYSDATNETENVTITVYFANGTVFQNGTYAAQAVNLEYNITDYSNESFTVDFSLWHETFGNSPVSYAMGVFPGIAWDIGVNSTLYALYSLVLLILVGGIATRHSIVAGSVLFLITMIMLYFIGWLPVSRVSIVFIAVLLVLGIIVSSKQEGN